MTRWPRARRRRHRAGPGRQLRRPRGLRHRDGRRRRRAPGSSTAPPSPTAPAPSRWAPRWPSRSWPAAWAAARPTTSAPAPDGRPGPSLDGVGLGRLGAGSWTKAIWSWVEGLAQAAPSAPSRCSTASSTAAMASMARLASSKLGGVLAQVDAGQLVEAAEVVGDHLGRRGRRQLGLHLGHLDHHGLELGPLLGGQVARSMPAAAAASASASSLIIGPPAAPGSARAPASGSAASVALDGDFAARGPQAHGSSLRWGREGEGCVRRGDVPGRFSAARLVLYAGYNPGKRGSPPPGHRDPSPRAVLRVRRVDRSLTGSSFGVPVRADVGFPTSAFFASWRTPYPIPRNREDLRIDEE